MSKCRVTARVCIGLRTVQSGADTNRPTEEHQISCPATPDDNLPYAGFDVSLSLFLLFILLVLLSLAFPFLQSPDPDPGLSSTTLSGPGSDATISVQSLNK